MRLALVHPDVAALRRYLVDAGRWPATRMVYRRARAPLPERPRRRRRPAVLRRAEWRPDAPVAALAGRPFV